LPQHDLEPVLAQSLGERREATLNLGHKLVGFEDRGDHVTLKLETPQGPLETECCWMLACDGGRSSVRSALGIEAEGYSLAQIQGALPMRKIDELTQALLDFESERKVHAAHASPDAPRASASSQVSPLQLAPFHIAPGVTVLIDPTLVPDPHSIAESLALALRSTDAFTMQPRGGEDASIAAAREGRNHKRPTGGIE
jgi:hypothetical protein